MYKITPTRSSVKCYARTPSHTFRLLPEKICRSSTCIAQGSRKMKVASIETDLSMLKEYIIRTHKMKLL